MRLITGTFCVNCNKHISQNTRRDPNANIGCAVTFRPLNTKANTASPSI